MTDLQELMLPYVKEKASRIIGRKTAAGRTPAMATSLELKEGIADDILECMRELIRRHEYGGCQTLNDNALTPPICPLT